MSPLGCASSLKHRPSPRARSPLRQVFSPGHSSPAQAHALSDMHFRQGVAPEEAEAHPGQTRISRRPVVHVRQGVAPEEAESPLSHARMNPCRKWSPEEAEAHPGQTRISRRPVIR